MIEIDHTALVSYLNQASHCVKTEAVVITVSYKDCKWYTEISGQIDAFNSKWVIDGKDIIIGEWFEQQICFITKVKDLNEFYNFFNKAKKYIFLVPFPYELTILDYYSIYFAIDHCSSEKQKKLFSENYQTE